MKCLVSILALWAGMLTFNSVRAQETSSDQAESSQSLGEESPVIEFAPLTAEQESEILQEVKIPEGFKATVFAAPPAVNYPVFVASTVDGTVFISSDGNSSLDRERGRGRIIRLRDLDGDGRADESKVFCKVDAPRGLLWDHDRLFVMHPPHLSAFIDKDGDGVAESQEVLVKNLAFDYDQRPADHTTNGISLGVDGWLYIAGGDFGVLKAEGADGTTLTHRAGGVLRVRPDGSGLHVYSTGTRNILEVAISPAMEMFARDNTNDGGGWDVRLHHFTGNEDHGYPRLYKNFNDECIQPLADYGGGSGCGAVYIDEPGMGDWNDAPFTADWGTGALYRHTVKPIGATFEEVEKPKPFIELPRPTDADVDGNSRVYCASWKGASYYYAGPNVGFIVCVTPKDFTPAPMPKFEEATDQELIALLSDPSYRRRVEAQRVLKRRGNAANERLLADALKRRSPVRNLLDELQDTKSELAIQKCIEALAHSDPVVVHTAIRCLSQRGAATECLQALDAKSAPAKYALRALAMMHREEVVDALIERMQRAEGEERDDLLAALCRLYYQEGEWAGDSWGTRPDTRGPYYQPVTWKASDRIGAVLDQVIAKGSSEQVAKLTKMMLKNRIERNGAIDRLIADAAKDKRLIPEAMRSIAGLSVLPATASSLVEQAIDEGLAETINLDLLRLLERINTANTTRLMMKAIAVMEPRSNPDEMKTVARMITGSETLGNHVDALNSLAANSDAVGLWAKASLLAIAASKQSSPEGRESASTAVTKLWKNPENRHELIAAAMKIDSHFLDKEILAAIDGDDTKLAELAKEARKKIRIRRPQKDDSPLVNSTSIEKATEQIIKMRGDVDLGKQIFAKANCAQCHTVSLDEVQKGPYLGTIAQTYQRPALVEAVLQPNKTIAQGFATNVIVTADGNVITGFITDEQSDRVSIRDGLGKEMEILKDEIEHRKTSDVSVMPADILATYTVFEAASLFDYLQSLVQQNVGEKE